MIRVNKYYAVLMLTMMGLVLLIGGDFLYLAFYTALIITFFSLAYILIVKYALKFQVEFKRDYYSTGDSCESIIKLNFDFLLPIPYLKVKSDILKYSEGEHTGEVTNMNYDEDKWIKRKITFNKRGLYYIGKAYIEVSDIFKIFTYIKHEDKNINVKVYPKIYKIDYIDIGGKDIFLEKYDKHSTNEDQSIIKDVRKYRLGDSLKKVHWKISAKLGELYVKNTETISGEQYVVLVDMNKENYNYEDVFVEERVVELASSILHYLSEREINADVYFNKKNMMVKQVMNKQTFDEFMDFIVTEKSDGELCIQEFIYSIISRIHRSNKMLLVLPDLKANIVENTLALRDMGFDVSVFYCVETGNNEEYRCRLQMAGISCTGISEIMNCET
ncbi:DUF58 domain-containing protein [Clostridium thermarum]|uniref:DUF58 domain-containing protein n=1 Tax=Clostridium thermarum TaxID=1716543 RepID=UPI001124C215|nr:DUF58 domain-containing protein [Clostridium thermarum]